MGVFRDADEFYACIGAWLVKVSEEPRLFDAIADSGIVVRFRYSDPDASITVDARSGSNAVLLDETKTLADVELWMPADIAHRFWMGSINPIGEVFAGRITYRGSLSKLTRFLPLLRPAMEHYPQHLQDVGMRHLLTS
ncbi:hypothetical protein FJZ36_02495 [Candidatus Poribacteria bacterium]|nr:hypothetical protein [Candidatus Poribacteria bacterium]